MRKYSDPLASPVICRAIESLTAEGHPRDKLIEGALTMRDVPPHVLARVPKRAARRRDPLGGPSYEYYNALHNELCRERALRGPTGADTSWYDEAFWVGLGVSLANLLVREGATEADLWRAAIIERAHEQYLAELKERRKRLATEAPEAYELHKLKDRARALRSRIAKAEADLAALRKREEENPFLSLTGEAREAEERLAERRELLRKHESKIAELKAAKKTAERAT